MNFKGEDDFFDPVRARQYSELIKKLNIKYINTKWNEELYFKPNRPDVISVKKIRDFCRENNVTITSFHYNGPIFQHDGLDQSFCRGLMKQSIDLYSILKPQVMVVHPGNLSLGRSPEHKKAYQEALKIFTPEQLHQIIVDNFRYFGDIAQEKGIKIALENIFGGRFYSQIDDLVKLVSDINHPNVGYCFDCGHGNIDKINHAETIRIMGDKLFELHLHDNDGTKDSHLPIGFGTIDYVEIIKALNDINYQNTATFEFFRWPTEDRIEGVKNAIEFYQTLEKIAKEGYKINQWK
ncbi:MAG: sugar phosphate isomerase/epimerase family protein [Erysipelotrichaceae bacterium]|jgi:sugar phosphate isomerase/epimerase